MRKAITALIITLLLVQSAFGASTRQATENISDSDMADKLVGEGKIPMYVRDKGKFVYNSEFAIVGISGINVNLRSQPNANANVVAQISKDDTDKWPAYLGEWTHPNGERWILGEIRRNRKPQCVWIYAEYAEPMTEETFSDVKNEINDSDFPDDLPSDVPTDQPKKVSAPAKKNINLSSPEEAAEFLEERLIELEKIIPSGSLEYLDSQTEQNRETCWEFSYQFNFTETGRYAISPSGKIYEYGNDKYSLVTQ